MNTILGIGTDYKLYTRESLNSAWVSVPNSGDVIAVTAMEDGTILGVGKDNQLYTRVTLNSEWINVPNSGSVIGATIMKDGTILGIGKDNLLYTRANLNSEWINVPNSGSVIGAAVMSDGTILGIGKNNLLYTRAKLNSDWVIIPDSGLVIGVTILPDGTILGIGMDNLLYTRATINSNWIDIINSGSVIGVTMVNMQNVGEFIGNVKLGEKDFEPGEQADLEFIFKNMSQKVRLKDIKIESIDGNYSGGKITVLKSQISTPNLEPGESTKIIITMKSEEDTPPEQYTILPMLSYTVEQVLPFSQVPFLNQSVFNISER